MKRFTPEEVDREFEIGGEIFKWRVPYWEEIANRLDKDVEQATRAINGSEAEKPEGAEEMPTTAHDVVADFIKRIEMFIDPENDGIKRWRALSKKKDGAIPMNAFRDLHQWLLETTTNRDPTEQSSQS